MKSFLKLACVAAAGFVGHYRRSEPRIASAEMQSCAEAILDNYIICENNWDKNWDKQKSLLGTGDRSFVLIVPDSKFGAKHFERINRHLNSLKEINNLASIIHCEDKQGLCERWAGNIYEGMGNRPIQRVLQEARIGISNVIQCPNSRYETPSPKLKGTLIIFEEAYRRLIRRNSWHEVGDQSEIIICSRDFVSYVVTRVLQLENHVLEHITPKCGSITVLTARKDGEVVVESVGDLTYLGEMVNSCESWF